MIAIAQNIVYKNVQVGSFICFIWGKIILYFEYKNNRHLMNTYIPMHLHFTVFHDLAVSLYSISVSVLCFTPESGIMIGSRVNLRTENPSR